jgi:DNA-directed RNA polymerase specialized sigma24 family protein
MPTSSFSSSSVTEFEKLLDRLRRGDDDAAWQLVGEYGPHVTAVVRRMIRTQMRVRVDSQDLAQTVWKSFFLNIEEMTNVRTPEELIKTLVRVTQHKVQDAYRRQLYLARNGAMRERQFEARDLARMARRVNLRWFARGGNGCSACENRCIRKFCGAA